MIKVFVYYIAKTKDLSDSLCEEFIALSAGVGVKMEFINLFSKSIKEGQKQDAKEAQKSYTKEFLKVSKNQAYKIALSPNGKSIDSIEFAKNLENKGEIAFFIGGAYGLEEAFLNQCQCVLSLSPLTFSHKVAKVVLSEQVFRAFCLINNHPYHK
ncbi:23S rRNA (pseudouridine(1915)-N(3))-methyltransferase RlmH [Helicobacter sp.]|uniref:23S rRNA (pseudouridine(1915)-N(3))-methyltransferase RlmH n=1 Tax=Helicobacter sp. TaxID=218 RepID=UPI00258FBA5C|nr:23S rRNA (pseudouridine(1915)-N(3))-methyltransferase RlmH [Helicobacter sp.]MCI7047509.1 23S rRNA (pseudouridine(1915)-N(3))-methyltransferase RlmH [Helicobacter sp.]